MQGHSAARPAGTSLGDGACQIHKTDPPIVCHEAGRVEIVLHLGNLPGNLLIPLVPGHIFPPIGLEGLDQSVSAKDIGPLVGILLRHDQSGLCPVQLHAGHDGIPGIPDHVVADNSPAAEFQDGHQRGHDIRIHLQLPALQGLGINHPLLLRLDPHRGDRLHRPQQGQKSSHIIGPDIQDRSGPLLIEKLRIGMIPLPAVGDAVRDSADDFACHALIDQPAEGLQPGTHESIRRAAHIQTFLRRQLHDLPALRVRSRERLLRIHMLARPDRGDVIEIMRRRSRQIQDDINIRILKQLVAGIIGLPETIQFLFCPGLFRRAAGTGVKFHILRILLQICQIGIADITQPNDTNS